MWNDDSGASSLMKFDGFWDVSWSLLDCCALSPILDRSVSSPLMASWPCVSSVSLPRLVDAAPATSV